MRVESIESQKQRQIRVKKQSELKTQVKSNQIDAYLESHFAECRRNFMTSVEGRRRCVFTNFPAVEFFHVANFIVNFPVWFCNFAFDRGGGVLFIGEEFCLYERFEMVENGICTRVAILVLYVKEIIEM